MSINDDIVAGRHKSINVWEFTAIHPVPHCLSEQTESAERKLCEDIDTFFKALAQTKIDKFKRDKQDYKEGVIYSWSHSPFC